MANRKNAEEKKQEENKCILNDLLKESDNKTCADCGAVAPRWASASLGVFLCIKCSGIHRSMGTHISFVRSVGLDDWKEHEIQKMKETGNLKSNEIYEARIPSGYPRPKPGDNMGLERFIRDKYEAKRFVKKSTDTSTGGSSTSNSRSNTPNPRTQVPPPSALQSRTPVVESNINNHHNTALLFEPEPEFGTFVAAPTAPPATPASTASSQNSAAKSNIMSLFDVPQSNNNATAIPNSVLLQPNNSYPPYSAVNATGYQYQATPYGYVNQTGYPMTLPPGYGYVHPLQQQQYQQQQYQQQLQQMQLQQQQQQQQQQYMNLNQQFGQQNSGQKINIGVVGLEKRQQQEFAVFNSF